MIPSRIAKICLAAALPFALCHCGVEEKTTYRHGSLGFNITGGQPNPRVRVSYKNGSIDKLRLYQMADEEEWIREWTYLESEIVDYEDITLQPSDSTLQRPDLYWTGQGELLLAIVERGKMTWD